MWMPRSLQTPYPVPITKMNASLLKIFYPATIIQHPLPANLKEHDKALFANDLNIALPQSGLYQLPRAWVTDLGIVYTDFRLHKNNVVCYHADFRRYRWRYFFKALLTFRKLRFRGQKALLAFDNYSGPRGFAHWICDGLTRLAELNDELDQYTLIVPHYFRHENIYQDSLRLFNVNKIHYLEPRTATWFSKLYFPSHIGDTGNFHPENIRRLNSIISSRLGAPQQPTRNIYISRAKASRRFVENETEVVELMSRRGFETVYMEDLRFPQQIELIRSAATVVSIHGAALALLAFAQHGSNVVEFRGRHDAVNNMYFLLAGVCGLNYSYLTCESSHQSHHGNAFNIRVDLTALEAVLEHILNRNNV